MCPSYQVTREEKHSTRGRARLLFEMLQGEVIHDGWRSREVFDALDLCLACKGCTSDCPVHVDMPTLKAEFLHHHYRSPLRPRPRHAYAFGFIDQVSRLASRFPELANAAVRTPGAVHLLRWAGGIDQRRRIPSFAPMTLQAWFEARGGTANPDGRPVVLFPDTFNNRLHTQVGVACVEAIEAAGWRVVMPSGHICCGRPLYDFGFLDAAERYLRTVVDRLAPYVRSGIPVVGMEPSCLAVLRDELPKLFPHDDDAARVTAHALHLGELFDRYDLEVPRLDAEALLWNHCHHRATGGVEAERRVLTRMGLDVDPLVGGCCGLAGSWGFEAGKYDISLECGEQALLPAVREAAPATVVVADGFSCRTQIEEAGTGRRALHLAEVMRLARQDRDGGRPGTAAHARPEDRLVSPRPVPGRGARLARTVLPLASVGAGVATVARRARRHVGG